MLLPAAVHQQVAGARRSELSALAIRRYLDALCVYFWAATQLLFSVTTFGLMVLLTPAVVFTSLALFNVGWEGGEGRWRGGGKA